MGKTLSVIALLVMALGALLFLRPSPRVPLPPPGAQNLKVGLVTIGAINAGGWSQSEYEGWKKIEKDLGAKISNTVAPSANDAFAAFRQYGSDQYNVVIGHARECFDPKTLEISAAYPQMNFLISGSERAEKNVI